MGLNATAKSGGMMAVITKFIPSTPSGTLLDDLEADTENGAWRKLVQSASRNMPYRTKQDFIKRGYTVDEWEYDDGN
jgi:hypothetical protein